MEGPHMFSFRHVGAMVALGTACFALSMGASATFLPVIALADDDAAVATKDEADALDDEFGVGEDESESTDPTTINKGDWCVDQDPTYSHSQVATLGNVTFTVYWTDLADYGSTYFHVVVTGASSTAKVSMEVKNSAAASQSKGATSLTDGECDFTYAPVSGDSANTVVFHLVDFQNSISDLPITATVSASIENATVKVAAQTYTGAALTPEPAVTFWGKTLTKGVDYSVTKYANNKNAGSSATVTVTGMGLYEGAKTVSFSIKQANISKAIVVVPDQTYTGEALTPDTVVTLGGVTLKKNTDYYNVKYSNNTNVGVATVTVCGRGNYTGTAKGTFTIVAAKGQSSDPTFVDVTSDTAHAADIEWLASTGVSQGWTETDGTKTYRPLESVARADMAAFLYRLAGSPSYTAPTKSPFADVSSNTAHYKEICWLASKGISTGWTESNGTKTFRPYASVTRVDMAAFLYRLAGSPSYSASTQSPFADCDSGMAHYKEVYWLASAGISEGWTESDGSKTFRPYTTVTRADMAAFLHRMYSNGLVKVS